MQVSFFFLLAIAEVYVNEGDVEFNKGEYNNAIEHYTEGINVHCKDELVNAVLFTDRATAYFYLVKA